MTAKDNGDDNIYPPRKTTSQIEERLAKDDTTNEVYMPLFSTIDLKRKKELPYDTLDFENGLRIDALVDSRVYVSAIDQGDVDRIKKSPANVFKNNDALNLQTQVSNGQLEKPVATATLKIEIWDNSFAEHFVVVKN